MKTDPWPTRDRILHLKTRWFTLIGEQLENPHGALLDYWRVEKADSVIILPIQRQRLLLPPPTYRPGVGKPTLDFPGGRCPANQRPDQAALAILQRELGVSSPGIARLVPLNQTGWAINSSFSNQLLYGFVANLKRDVKIPAERLQATYSTDPAGLQSLLAQIDCLQCRLVLREWQAQSGGTEPEWN